MWFRSSPEGLISRTSDGISSSLKAGRLEIQEESMFQFKFKGWKRPMFQLKHSGTGSYSAFLFYSGLQLNG